VAFFEDAEDLESQSAFQQLPLGIREAQIREHVAGTFLELDAGSSSFGGCSLGHVNDASTFPSVQLPPQALSDQGELPLGRGNSMCGFF